MDDSIKQPETQLEPKKDHKVSMLLVALLITIIIAGGVWYFLFRDNAEKASETNTSATAATSTTTTPSTTGSTSAASAKAIQNDSDLQAESADLDSTDLNSIDTSLSQNDTDSSEF